MQECQICKSKEALIKAKDEEGKVIYICESCYEGACEGYERLDE